MKKIFGIILLAFSLTSCLVPPKKSLGTITVPENASSISNRLFHQTEKCWKREDSILKDGVIVSKLNDPHEIIIEAKRYAGDIGIRPPFIEIAIRSESHGSTIEIIEGGEVNPISDGSLAQEIKSWIDGSEACISQK